MRALLLVFVACFLLLATAKPQATQSGSPLADIMPQPAWQPNEIELCTLVGENSGCSGCVLGTQGLCSWVGISGYNDDLVVGSVKIWAGETMDGGDYIKYQCLPTRFAMRNLYPIGQTPQEYYWDASYLCPADSKDEPIPDEDLTNWDKGIIYPQSHTLLSKTHHRKLIDFPTANGDWTVDRTSRWGSMGMLFTGSEQVGDGFERSSVPTSRWGAFTCQELNSMNDMEPYDWRQVELQEEYTRPNTLDYLLYMCPSNANFGSSDWGWPRSGAAPIGDYSGSTNITTGPFWRQQDKFCAKQYLDYYATTRCPQYGVPISGICESTAVMQLVNCGDSHVQPQWGSYNHFDGYPHFNDQTRGPTNGWPSKQHFYGHLLGYRIVADNTPYCIGTLGASPIPLEITGQMEHIAGLDRPLSVLNSAAGTECYDCCD